MNNIIKELKHLEPISEGVNYNKNRETYNTNYDILQSDGSLLNSYRRESCFVTAFCNSNDFRTNRKTNNKLIIYALSEDTRLTNKEVHTYIKYLKTLGIPFKFTEHENYNLNWSRICNGNLGRGAQGSYNEVSNDLITEVIGDNNKLKDQKKILCFKEQTVYIMEIDLTRVTTLLEIKLLANYFRYIYEYDNDYMLKKALAYKKIHRNISFFQIFALIQHISQNTFIPESDSDLRVYGSKSMLKYGHSLVFDKFYINYTTKKIKEVIKSLKNSIDFGNELNNFRKKFDYIRWTYENKYGPSYTCKVSNKPLTLNDSFHKYINEAIREPSGIYTPTIIKGEK